jgi:hypothetical protein
VGVVPSEFGGLDRVGGAMASLAIEAVALDRDHLAAYCRVCGFRVADRLPPTYLHVVAFPLALSLMTERSFPFPLLGMVHVANRIERRRALGGGDRPAFRVWAENLRPHRRGRQLDVVAEAAVEGALCWREASTYLRRGEGAKAGAATAANAISRAARSSPYRRCRATSDAAMRRSPATATRSICTAWRARPFGFDGAIAHGMWMKARCLAALEGRLPDAFAAAVEFRSPLGIPGRARFRLASEDGGWSFALERGDGERTHLTGLISAGAGGAM